MTTELLNVLLDWRVWLGAAIFGIVSRSLMRAFTSSALSNAEFAGLMTLFNFLLVSVLVLWLGPVLLMGQRAPSITEVITERTSTLLLVIGIGGVVRLLLQIVGPPGSPNPKATIQAALQLVLLAITLSDGAAALWPGWVFFLALVVGGLVVIAVVEELIATGVPQQAVTTTVTISGVLVLPPLLVYAAWFRDANPAPEWIC